MAATKLLSAGFVDAFRDHIKDAQGLRVASAWLSDSDAFGALLAQPGIKLKAIIGTYGTSTDPAALQKVVRWFGFKSLRIVAPPELFHPKLFLFEKRDRTIAWIGSANFTRGGVTTNTELMLETDQARAVAPMEDWFDDLWSELAGQDVEAALTEYEMRWEAAAKPREGEDALRDLVEGQETPLVPLAAGEIRIHPSPKKGNRFPGEFEFGDGEREAYDSIADGLRRLLLRLAERRDDFLQNCAGRPEYKDAGKPRIVKRSTEARARRKLPGRKHISVSRLADSHTEGQGWWLSEDTTTGEKWAMAKAAVEVFNEMSLDGSQLRLVDESLKSWPRTV